jgi:primosomal protein N' (replication factor Y)
MTKRKTAPDQDDLFAADIPPPPTPVPAPSKYAVHVTVALDVPVDRVFTYGVGPGLAQTVHPGGMVKVRFAGRPMIGLVLECGVDPPPGVRIMPILGTASPTYTMSPAIRELAAWIAHRWFCPIGESLRCAAFVGFQDVGQRLEEWVALTDAGREIALGREKAARLSGGMKAILGKLAAHNSEPALRVADVVEEGVALRSSVVTLARRGLLILSQRPLLRTHESLQHELKPDPPRELKPAQTKVLQRVLSAMEAGISGDEHASTEGWLLHGVTGSGKTEIYLRAAAHALDQGGTALILVPEISLTPQAVDRFRSRLGPTVGVYHSKMTMGQKIDLHARIVAGDCRVVVGARSGVFAPLPNLKLIVVDEEHEQSYKQDAAPRYHGRDVAIERGRREGALVLLGSATPSLESYHGTRTGRLELLELPERVDGRALPPVTIVDLTAEAKAGRTPDILSAPLSAAMEQALESQQQTLLFLNRRGYFNFAVCLACQEPVKCPHCDATLTHHRPGDNLTCHYCGHHQSVPKTCPTCRNPEVGLLGLGTQRIESMLKERFPGKRILRIDADTMKKRTAYIDAWHQIEDGQFDILVGTQVVAKGLHLEGITVVGVPLADGSLFQPDFRAAERAFSLLTQVAGRAGRGDHPGRVFLQTYVPRHYAIRHAETHDYAGFYEREIKIRETLRFPPHARLVTLLASGADASQVREAIRTIAWNLREAAGDGLNSFQILGPAPAPLNRLQDLWRWRLIIRTPDHDLVRKPVVDALQKHHEGEHRNSVAIMVDADPYDLS